MSSSSKQTELRRLMKLQLEKQQAQEKVSHAPRGILKSSKTTTAVKPNSGVSSLLAAYEDDDSDSSVERYSNAKNETSTRVSWPTEEVKLKQSRIIEVTSDEQQRKRARLEPAQEAGGLTDERIQAIQAEMGIMSTPTSTTQIPVGDTETEDEFQALLDQANDDDKTNNADSNQQQQASEETNEAESIDMTEMEQVSYQARIAQLRLKAAARQNKKRTTEQISPVDTYTPELALGNDEQEEKEKNGHDLTPLEILRRKRLEAKKSRESSEEST